jgi:hypothetical protein
MTDESLLQATLRPVCARHVAAPDRLPRRDNLKIAFRVRVADDNSPIGRLKLDTRDLS